MTLGQKMRTGFRQFRGGMLAGWVLPCVRGYSFRTALGALSRPVPPSSRRWRGGQATTEVVLLMPLFMFFLYAFAKVFAMLLLVQKMEIASYYAARRWQLESHRNANYVQGDKSTLLPNIQQYVNEYLGVQNPSVASFLGIQGQATLTVNPTQVWQIVTLTLVTRPIHMPLMQINGVTLTETKYVPNRDRPIAFILPGLQQNH